MRKLANVLVIWLIMAVAIGAIGCSEKASPTPTPEPTVPPNFTTYTDENNLFSISYPQDWETPLAMLEDIRQATIELYNSMNLNIPVPADVQFNIFTAGKLKENGLNPNLNITAYTLDPGLQSLDANVEANVRGFKAFSKDMHVLSRVKTTIDGKEAEIIEIGGFVEGTSGGMSIKLEGHMLQMYTIGSGNVWIVQCITLEEEYSYFENDFYYILRSFRILD